MGGSGLVVATVSLFGDGVGDRVRICGRKQEGVGRVGKGM